MSHIFQKQAFYALNRFLHIGSQGGFVLSSEEATYVCASSGEEWLALEEGGCQKTETLALLHDMHASIWPSNI